MQTAGVRCVVKVRLTGVTSGYAVTHKEFPGPPHLWTDLGFSIKVWRGLQEKLFGDGRQDQVRTGPWKPFKFE